MCARPLATHGCRLYHLWGTQTECAAAGSDCAYMLLYRQRLPFDEAAGGLGGGGGDGALTSELPLPPHLQAELGLRLE